MRILLLGSTYLTAKTAEFLLNQSDITVVGYCANTRRNYFPGRMPVEEVDEDEVEYDIKLSIQYDKIIKNTARAYNVHTGFLPSYGGVDTVYHAYRNNETYQGITFHKMTEVLDGGQILSRISFPLKKNTIAENYMRLAVVMPSFVYTSLRLLQALRSDEIEAIPTIPPRIYKSGQIDTEDEDFYQESGDTIIDLIKQLEGADYFDSDKTLSR